MLLVSALLMRQHLQGMTLLYIPKTLMQYFLVYIINYVSMKNMTEAKSTKMGRPVGSTKANPANKMLPVKVTEKQLKTYKAAAKRDGENFSAWVREKLDKASR